MKRTYLFSLFFFIFHFSFSENSILKSSEKFDKKRNLFIVEKILQMENLKINYKALHKKEEKESVYQKYGDFYLGCAFGRRGNGGWNLWKFLTVILNVDGNAFDGVRKYIIKDIIILEDGERKMAEFLWPLDENKGKILHIRIVKFQNIKEWFFMKIWFEGKNISFKKIGLSNYPGNTSGPPERERWIAASSGNYNMHKGKTELKKNDYSIVFFNKNAQEKYGCLLVFIPQKFEKITVSGTYGVGTTFIPHKNVKSVEFALGYFLDIPYQEVIKTFTNSEDKEILKKLNKINWQPQFDFSKLEESFGEISKYKEVITNYDELKKEKEEALKTKNPVKAIKLIRKFKEIKNKAIEEKLKEYM